MIYHAVTCASLADLQEVKKVAQLYLFDAKGLYFAGGVEESLIIVFTFEQEPPQHFVDWLATQGEPVVLNKFQLAGLQQSHQKTVQAQQTNETDINEGAVKQRRSGVPTHVALATAFFEELMRGPVFPQQKDLLAYAQHLRSAEWWRFTESAIRMIAGVYPKKGFWPEIPRETWIEFAPPVNLGHLCVAGIFATPIIHDYWEVAMYTDRCTRVTPAILYSTKENSFTNGTSCKDCTDTICCDTCQSAVDFLKRFFLVCVEITQRKYAVQADPPEYEKHTAQWLEHTHAVRSPGGSPKHIVTDKKAMYSLVSFEVSEVVNRTTSEEPGDRGNWLTLYGRDTWIYTKHEIAATERPYPLRQDGTRQEGVVSVEAHTRWVPMLREGITRGKQVVAKRYES
jgi:hypothetical protein